MRPDTVTLMERRVRMQIEDVVGYYGKTKREKAKLRRVANSILQRCRLAYKLLNASGS